MSIKEVNKKYGLSLKRGEIVNVIFCGRIVKAKITSSNHSYRVIVKPLFDERLRLFFHPDDIKPL